jgi:hypothetical protein
LKGEKVIIKKIIIASVSTILVIIGFLSCLFYNRSQSPNIDDVFNITDNWNPPTEEVYGVKKIDGKWLTFFRNEYALYVGELEQNWFGSWRLIDDTGQTGTLAVTHYPQNNKGITWAAQEVDKQRVYYFGMVSNPKVEKVIIEAQGEEYKNVPFIEVNEERFFFLRTKGDGKPHSFKALSKDGEILLQ